MKMKTLQAKCAPTPPNEDEDDEKKKEERKGKKGEKETYSSAEAFSSANVETAGCAASGKGGRSGGNGKGGGGSGCLPELNASSLPVGVVWQEPQQDMPLHSHRFHELVFIFKGHARHRYENRTYFISEGDIFLIPPGVEHAYLETSGLELVNILYFPQALAMPMHDLLQLPGYHAFFEFEPAMREKQGFEGRLRVHGWELENLRSLAMEFTAELDGRKPGCLFECVALLMQMILRVSRLYDGYSSTGAQEDLLRLGRVLSLMQKSCCGKPLRMKELARKAGMSQSGFYRSFRKTLGVSPMEYLLSLRLSAARDLLEHSAKTIGEIAEETGFEDSNYFSRAFRKSSGMSPREFRRTFSAR